MEELWGCVERHLASRHDVAAIESRLAQLAHQLRAVQKRMLLRFKDKQPASLAHLDLLIQETFAQLTDLGQDTALPVFSCAHSSCTWFTCKPPVKTTC